MLVVKTKKLLKSIKNHEDGELALVEKTKKVYKYDKTTDSWDEMKAEGGLKMNLFEINKTAIPQLPTLTPEVMHEKKAMIKDFVANGKFYMLLSNSKKYYTIFMRGDSEEEMDDAIMSCLQGDVKSIELTDDGGAIEIWSVIDGEAYEFYLFNYEMGVIVCR